MPEISFKIFTLYIPTINNYSIVYEKYITITAAGLSNIDSILGSLSNLKTSEIITEEDLNNFIAAGYNVEDNLIDSSTGSFVEIINEDPTGGVAYDYETLSAQLANPTVDSPVSAYLDKYKLETYLATLPTPITPSDTPLVSMVLVDDNNNRTTFNGSIINDFTITEDLQSKITQLTILATNISNLQTRLTNITNILNTQNIEFTDNVSNVSSAGSKLYVSPSVFLSITLDNIKPNLYLNLSPYLLGVKDISSIVPKTFNVYLPKGYSKYGTGNTIPSIALNNESISGSSYTLKILKNSNTINISSITLGESFGSSGTTVYLNGMVNNSVEINTLMQNNESIQMVITDTNNTVYRIYFIFVDPED